MNAVHASNTPHIRRPGECGRFWPQDHGQWLWCGELIVPGEDYCLEHELEMQRETHPKPKRRRERYDLTPRQVQQFWAKVNKRAGSDCWVWTAAVNRPRGGYGCFSANGYTYRTHRLAYVLTVGPIPGGLHLDHLCRNPPCCNPAHLEPVTNRENSIRGVGPTLSKARFAAQTHCKHGHPFSGDNLIIVKRGTPNEQRGCKACNRTYQARYKAKKRQQGQGAA